MTRLSPRGHDDESRELLMRASSTIGALVKTKTGDDGEPEPVTEHDHQLHDLSCALAVAAIKSAQPCQWPDCHGHYCQGGNFKGCERAGEMAAYGDDTDDRSKAESEAMWLLVLIFVGAFAVVGTVAYFAYEWGSALLRWAFN